MTERLTREQTEAMAYYAFWKTCRCVAAISVDEPAYMTDTAKDVAGYIRRGLLVERIVLRSVPLRCDEHPEGTPHPWELEKRKAVQESWL